MTNAIVTVLTDPARKIEAAIGDAGQSVERNFRDTGIGPRKFAYAHAEHDPRAATALERDAQHTTGDVKPRGGGNGGRSGRGSGAPVGPDNCGNVPGTPARDAKVGEDVRRGHARHTADPRTREQLPPGYRPMQGKAGPDYTDGYLEEVR